MEDVKVLGASLSPFCWRIEWALKHKGIEYEYIEQDLGNKSTLLLQSNPVHKKVPVLLHHARPISESLVILEYIDETWTHDALLPKDPLERAMARFWAKFVDDKCVMNALSTSRAKGNEQEKAIDSTQESLKFLEELIEGKKFFGGETIGFLDLVVGSLPNWLRFLEAVEGIKLFEAEKFPSLCEWAERFSQIPIIKERMPKTEDLVIYFQAQRKGKQAVITAAN